MGQDCLRDCKRNHTAASRSIVPKFPTKSPTSDTKANPAHSALGLIARGKIQMPSLQGIWSKGSKVIRCSDPRVNILLSSLSTQPWRTIAVPQLHPGNASSQTTQPSRSLLPSTSNTAKIWPSEVSVTSLSTAVVNKHIATYKSHCAQPSLLQRPNQGIHGNAVAVTLQRFTIIKSKSVVAWGFPAQIH